MFAEAQKGAEFGVFRVLRTLGHGGMGVVYAACNQATGELAAVKTGIAASPEVVAMLRAEIQTLSLLDHPGIVRLLGSGSRAGMPWYAMELLPGGALTQWMDSLWADAPLARHAKAANGRLESLLTLVHRLCGPLRVLHARGLVHRDLNPANVFLRESGQPLLTDLGLVWRSRGSVGRERLEVHGRAAGTWRYMSPEQALGSPLDARADLYSVGALLYEGVTHRSTVSTSNLRELPQLLQTEMPPDASTVVEGVPPALDELLRRLLARKPRDRLGHVEDLAVALVELGAEPDPTVFSGNTSVYLYRPTLVGRSEALGSVAPVLDLAASGVGGLILVRGESGIGKTSLAAEITAAASPRRFDIVTGECVPVHSGQSSLVLDVTAAPLHPLRRLLQLVADRCRERGGDTARRLLGPRAQILSPYEAALVGTVGGLDNGPLEPLGGEASRRRTLRALTETVEALLQLDGKLLVVLDDLQWVDELTMSWLEGLTPEWFAANPLVLVGTWRSEEEGRALRELWQRPDAVQISLGRLSSAAVANMVRDMLALAEPPGDLVAEVTRHAEGNPFFVAEYLRLAANEGALVRDSGRWQFTGAALKNAPESLNELIVRRLAGLSDAASRTLAHGAVLGRKFDSATLAHTLGSQAEASIGALRELIDRNIVELSENSTVSFTHHKLREAAYRRIKPAERPALHEAAASALEAALGAGGGAPEYAMLAHHWQEAGNADNAIGWFERAGEASLYAFDNDGAVAHFHAALELRPRAKNPLPDPRVGRWYRALVEAELERGRVDEGFAAASWALKLLGDPRPEGVPMLALGILRELVLRMLNPVFAPLRARSDARQRDVLAEAATVHQRLLENLVLRNLPLHAVYTGLRAVALAERTDPAGPTATRAFAFMSIILGTFGFNKAASDWAGRARANALASRRPETVAYAHSRTAALDVAARRWALAESSLDVAFETSMKIGDSRGANEARAIRLHLQFWRGNYTSMAQIADAMLELSQRQGDLQTREWAYLMLTHCHVRAGNRAALADCLAALGEFAAGDGEDILRRGGEAQARAFLGDHEAALWEADAALQLMRNTPPVGYFTHPGVVATALVFLEAWDRARAAGSPDAASLRKRSKEAVGFAKALTRFHSFARPTAALVLGRFAAIDGSIREARAHLRSAIALAEESGMPWEMASAELDLAERLGDEPALHSARAEVTAGNVGAAPLVQRALDLRTRLRIR